MFSASSRSPAAASYPFLWHPAQYVELVRLMLCIVASLISKMIVIFILLHKNGLRKNQRWGGRGQNLGMPIFKGGQSFWGLLLYLKWFWKNACSELITDKMCLIPHICFPMDSISLPMVFYMLLVVFWGQKSAISLH